MPNRSTVRSELLGAYAAALSRLLAWMVITRLVYRADGADVFALASSMRGVVSALAWFGLGIGPALLHLLSLPGLSTDEHRQRELTSTALLLLGVMGMLGLSVVRIYSALAPYIHVEPALADGSMPTVALLLALGMLLRVLGDGMGFISQWRGRLVYDSWFAAGADACAIAVYGWVAMTGVSALVTLAWAFAASGGIMLAGKLFIALRGQDLVRPAWSHARAIMGYGVTIVAGQLADFLYAPAAYLLIGHTLGMLALADYVPCIEIDAALLLLVSGIGVVLLPRSARAFASADAPTLWRYFVRATVASLVLLVAGSLVALLLAGPILQLRLGEVRAGTLALLPLVLVHTIIGGSGMPGRTILLAIGKAPQHTAAVIAGGVLNFALALLLVTITPLGLYAIAVATIIAVSLRCAVWQPWYVARCLRRLSER